MGSHDLRLHIGIFACNGSQREVHIRNHIRTGGRSVSSGFVQSQHTPRAGGRAQEGQVLLHLNSCPLRGSSRHRPTQHSQTSIKCLHYC